MTAYLVKLTPGLDSSRLAGIWSAIRLLPGVESMADMERISQDTLDSILYKPEPEVQQPKKRRKKVA